MSVDNDNAFDHLVIITRACLSDFVRIFEQSGFKLTPLAKHNLGSINRLIVLDSTYIELLGWESDKPLARKEIVDLDYGLDALVFRTNDAERTYHRLLRLGFDVQPVQNLSRPAQYEGKEVTAEFKAVRFSKQPIDGLRIYFCEHRTPDFVWNTEWQSHKNLAKSLVNIEIFCKSPHELARILNQLLELEPYQAVSDNFLKIQLENVTLSLKENNQLLPEINLIEIQIPNQLISISNKYLKENLGDP
jgi:hypothetical protein